jgi:transposase
MQIIENYQTKTQEELIKLVLSFNEANQQLMLEKEKQQEDFNRRLIQLQQQIESLTEALKLALHRHYGTKSETLDNPQLLLFNEASLPTVEEQADIEESEEDIQVGAHTRHKKRGRKGLPAHYPRIEKIYDLSEAEKVCPCGCTLNCIGEERTEQLEIIPEQPYVIVHVQKKYACTDCEGNVKQAEKPMQPIPGSIAGPQLLAKIISDKFNHGLPLYRQEKRLQQHGIDLARKTLSLWVIRISELLLPLEKLMQDGVFNYDIAYSDETRVQVLDEPNRKAETKSWMWLFSGGRPEEFCLLYRYDVSRGHEVPLAFFEDFKGYLHCDGFGAYETLASRNNAIRLSGCLYHARRKFIEADKLSQKKSGIAYNALLLIQKLAKREELLKGLPSETVHERRLEQEKPLLDELHALLIDSQPKVPPKSTLGQAISYTLNQWPKLLVYLEDGRLENNNNRSERAIKPFAIGRKNWMFCQSVEGAVAAARLYSFVETCKWHGVAFYYWLAYVLGHIQQCQTVEELEALLPYKIDKTLLAPKNFIPDLKQPPDG